MWWILHLPFIIILQEHVDGLDSISVIINNVLSRSVESQGISFAASKSKPFVILSEDWNYIKHKNNINSITPIDACSANSIVKCIRFGLRHVSIMQNLNWEHIRFRTILESQLIWCCIGMCSCYGITKVVPSKRDMYDILVHPNDHVNIN